MSDIIERLRYFSLARSGELHENVDAAMANDAADEIARLRALNAELLTTLQWLNHKGGLGLDVHERIRAAIAKAEGGK